MPALLYSLSWSLFELIHVQHPSISACDTIVIGGLPAKMKVEADVGTGVSAKTVGELRKVTAWSENLVITTPKEHHPEAS
jgi:hypothetical protein